jgi:hypothetical protein
VGVLECAAVESWPSWQAPSAWQADAACRGLPLEVFFPDGTGASKFEQAKAICAGCSVIADCRAMTDRAERGLSSDVFGVFARESPLERVRRRHAPGFVTMGPKSLSHAEPNGPTARLDLSR